jgi:hypothetical protein
MDPKRGLKSTGTVPMAGNPGRRPDAAPPKGAERNAGFQEALELLDRDIQRLRVDFERFFNGALPFPPEELRNRIQTQLRGLRNASGLGVMESFQVGNLEARFNTYGELFNRRLRDAEEGRRHAGQAAAAPAATYDADQAVEALYSGLAGAGEGPRFDLGSFRSYLSKQIEAIRQKTGCSEVQFRLAVEEGKLKLKARPLGASPKP